MAITELDVHAAADALLRDGERPTIDRVRLKLGRGSPNTITGFLNTWFAGLGERLAGARGASLPDPVARLAQDLWRAALEQARQQAEAHQAEQAGQLAAERERLATVEQDLAQGQARLQAREADLELGVQALREQLVAAQDAAYAATARLQAQQQQLALARDALTQARSETEGLRGQLVDLQTRQAQTLDETQARHAAQERRWLNELDAERQATKRLTTELDRARQTAERDRQAAERERQAAERERQAAERERQTAEQARGETQALIADLQNELRQALRTETTLRADLATATARLNAGQVAAQAREDAATQRESDLLRQIHDLSAQLAAKDKQLDSWAQSLAPRRAGRRAGRRDTKAESS